MTRTKTTDAYQLRVALKYVEPPIWRRLLVPSSCTLWHLHGIIQVAMGWTDSHLHHFMGDDGTAYRTPDQDSFEGGEDETKVRLATVLTRAGQRLAYEYDFGDSWLHAIVLEKILGADAATILPRCIAGERACPPEDCGGVPGYERLVEIIADPAHPEHEDMLEWIDQDFDPERIDIDEINAQLVPGKRRRN